MVLLSGMGGGGHGPRPIEGLPSQHQLDGLDRPDPGAPLRVDGLDGGRTTTSTVFGFLPYWEGYSSLRYDLLSVLACFSIEMGPSGTITAWHGFPSAFQTPVAGIHAAGGIAVVTVTNFSSSQIHSILTTGRVTAVATLSGVLDDTSVDGICIDFEGVSASDGDSLTTFMEDLREEMDRQHPGSHLSICTPAVDWSGAFDYDMLAATCDALFMMCYPFHGSWSEEAGPCCPLTGWGYDEESPSNMAWSMGDYVIYAPEVHEKLVVGLPYYGFEWDTEGQYTHSDATGSCSTLIYSTLAGRAESYGRLWDGESLTPWYAYYDTGWNQGWYDDEESLGLKYGLILGSGLQGAGIWALGYDGTRPELWECLEDWFCAEQPPDGMTDNLEDSFTLHGPASSWHYSGTGRLWSHFYTYSVSSGSDVNWAEWSFELADSSMEGVLEAWIPEDAEATALYRVASGGAVDTVTVDQSLFHGSWVPLGGARLPSGGLSVILGDRTGTPDERMAFDAIRFVPVGHADPGEPSCPLLAVSANPAPGFEITIPPLSGEAVLLVLDCAGRVVSEVETVPGTSTVACWPGRDGAPSGLYHAVLFMDGSGVVSSIRMVLVR